MATHFVVSLVHGGLLQLDAQDRVRLARSLRSWSHGRLPGMLELFQLNKVRRFVQSVTWWSAEPRTVPWGIHGIWREAGQIAHEGSHMPDSVDSSAFDVPRVDVTHPTWRLAVRYETRSRVVAVVDFKSRSSRRLAEPHRSVAARIRTGLTVAPCK